MRFFIVCILGWLHSGYHLWIRMDLFEWFSVGYFVQMWWCKATLFSSTLSRTEASFSSVESSRSIGILSLSTNLTPEGQDCVVVTKCNITVFQSCVQHHETLKWKGVPYCTSSPDTWSWAENTSKWMQISTGMLKPIPWFVWFYICLIGWLWTLSMSTFWLYITLRDIVQDTL